MRHITLSTLILAACGGVDAPDLAGTWTDDFGTGYVVDEASVQISYEGSPVAIFHIEEVDNDAGFLLAQNDAANEYFPELYSRFDWAEDGGATYLCQSAFDGETLDEARGGSADASDFEAGCGGFPWSMLTAE
jgi:hypothetical protein